MTVDELKEALDQFDGSTVIKIRVRDGSNPRTLAHIRSVEMGIDWEHGKVVIVPEMREGE